MPRGPVRSVAVLAISGAVCAGCIGRQHIQHDGSYQFTAQQVLRDDCGLQRGSSVLWSGVMLISGDLLRMQMDESLYGMEAAGYFLYGVEQFTLDGTAGRVTVPVGGLQCDIGLVQAHMDATTDSARDFHGTAQVQLRSEQVGCFCELSVRFTASMP